MEETLFDSQGNPIAYVDFKDGGTIYLWNGKPVAYLHTNKTIYGFNGKHLGWYENGIVWNPSGERNGYNKSALPVYAKYERYKSYKQYKPYKAYTQYAKYKPYYKTFASTESLSQFLLNGAK
jgi:hypothetical protein